MVTPTRDARPTRKVARIVLATALAGCLMTAAATVSIAQGRAEARTDDAAGEDTAGDRKSAQPRDKPGQQPPGEGKSAQGGGEGGKGAPNAMFVGVDKVQKGPIQQTTPVVGRIVSREGGVVSARTPGPVEEMRVHVGDRVKKGDVLAVLVTDLLHAEVSNQRAELRLAKQKLERLEKLRTTSSAAFQRATYDDHVQELARAQAKLRIAELALKYSRIVAPFDGVVTKRHTDAGAYLPIGGQVVTLINDRNLELEVDVSADRLAGLTPGAKVHFETASGRNYTGAVRAIVPEQNPMTRTLAVRIKPDFTDNDPRRAINQSITVEIPVGKARDVVSVHKDGIIANGDEYMAYVVVKGRATPRPVAIGESIGSRYVVERGLAPGDIVVIRGNERLRPGMPVVFRKGS